MTGSTAASATSTSRGSYYSLDCSSTYTFTIDIRAWLNETFYTTAFSDLQKALIQTTAIDNSAASTTDTGGNITKASYVCSDTNDKVFLLSEYEVTTTSYGFSSYSTYNTARQKKTTDYAQCQGAYTSTSSSYLGCGGWWLRSPSSDSRYYARNVISSGNANYGHFVHRTNVGVVPAINITL